MVISSAALGAGCVAASMSARHARAPVLLDPVACIGCSPTPEPAPAASPGAAPITDVTDRWSSTTYVLYSAISSGGGKAPELDLKTERALDDVCRSDVRLAKIHATSFGIDAFLFFRTSASIEVQGFPNPVGAGVCGPRPWPYSGPRGLVLYDQPPPPPVPVPVPVPVPASPPVPAPAPVPASLQQPASAAAPAAAPPREAQPVAAPAAAPPPSPASSGRPAAGPTEVRSP
jgi:hypothetical protein